MTMNNDRQINDDKDLDDGWGSDLDIEDDEDDDDIIKSDDNDYRAITPITTNRKVVSTTIDVLGVPSTTTTTTTTTTNSTGEELPIISNDGWDNDDDNLNIDYDDIEDVSAEANSIFTDNNQSTTIQQPPGNKYTKFEFEIHEYISSLPGRRIEQLKNVLHQEYNTPTKAMELYQYYQTRPQLLQYTIDKELSRLDYTIITTDAQQKRVVVQEKEQIRNILSSLQLRQDDESSASICGRCANQSILVDIVQAMTSQQQHTHGTKSDAKSDDMVLLPSQFMCTTIASHCHFTIDFIQSRIQVAANFDISMPIHNQRWIIGQIQTNIYFDCPSNNGSHQRKTPNVEFHVGTYVPLVDVPTVSNAVLHDNTDRNSSYYTNLQQCAATINELSMNDDTELLSSPICRQQQHNHEAGANNTFRDAYVQDLIASTGDVVVDGMKSAWQDFDTATGLVSKFKKLPSLLPTFDVDPTICDDYEQNAFMFQNEKERHHMSYANISVQEDQYGSKHLTQQLPQSRPTSLLGGFVRSLAQSVTLPKEDPSIYEEWQQRTKQDDNQSVVLPSSTISVAVRKGDLLTACVPRLYNVEPPSNRSNTTVVTTGSNVDGTNSLLYNIHDEVSHTNEQQYKSSNVYNANLASSIAQPVRHKSIEVILPSTISRVSHAKPITTKVTDPKGHLYETQEGWGDDIDVDDLQLDGVCNDTDPIIFVGMNEHRSVSNETKDPLPIEYQCSNDVPLDWLYDPVTDIIPTRRRYRNPYVGSRYL